MRIISVYSTMLFSPGWSVGTLVPFPIDCAVVLPVFPCALSCWVCLSAWGVFCVVVVVFLATHAGLDIPIFAPAAVAFPCCVLSRGRLDGRPWVVFSIRALGFA